jgi:hypothetical protein
MPRNKNKPKEQVQEEPKEQVQEEPQKQVKEEPKEQVQDILFSRTNFKIGELKFYKGKEATDFPKSFVKDYLKSKFIEYRKG